MRLIDADTFRRVLDTVYPFTKYEQMKHGMADKAKSGVLIALEKTPTVPQWIPCSERLPEEGYGVLVYEADNRNIFMASIENGKWYSFDIHDNLMAFDESDYGEPVAWMPPPEPYKGGEDEAEKEDEGEQN